MSRQAQIYLLILGLTAFFFHPYYSGWSFMTDEAVTVLGAQRWLQGELPYRDWALRTSWGSFALTAGWFKLWGDGQTGTRTLMLAIGALQGAVVYALSGPLPSRWRWLPCLLWATLGLHEFPILGYHWIALLFYSLAVLQGQKWLAHGNKPSAGWCGFWIAVAGTTLQSEGLAGVIFLILVGLVQRPKYWWSAIFAMLLTSLVLWTPLLPLAAQVWHQNVEQMRINQGLNYFPYSWKQLSYPWLGFRNSAWSIDPLGTAYAGSRFLAFALNYGTYFIVLLLVLVRSRKPEHQPVQVAALGLAALTLVRFSRMTLDYQAYLLPMWFVLLVWEVSRWRGNKFWLAALTGFSLLAWGLHYQIWQRDSRFAIATPAGIYWTDQQWQQEAFGVLGQWLTQVVPPGQRVVCLPYQACLYTLWKRPNPLRQPVLLPLSIPESDRVEMQQRMREQPVEWLIFTPIPAGALDGVISAPPERFEADQKRLFEEASAGYKVEIDYRKMLLLRRQ